MSYPILYPAANFATARNTLGLGTLSDCISCTVTEERNGPYELEMQYPLKGLHFEDIEPRTIILAKPNAVDDPQAFRVYKITKAINGICTIYAQHISYDLGGYRYPDQRARNNTEAGQILSKAPFTVVIENTGSEWWTSELYSYRGNMLGREDSALDHYGGEWHWDNYTCTLESARGSDNDVKIKYSQNMTSLEYAEDSSNVYTNIACVWTKPGEASRTGFVATGATLEQSRYLILDASDQFDERPTAEELQAIANAYLASHNLVTPNKNISVSFVQNEGKIINLCDTITVIHADLGVNVKAKCIKVTWDVLKDRYTNTVVGDYQNTITDTIANLNSGSGSSSSGSVSGVTDVQVDGTSVVTNNIAELGGAAGLDYTTVSGSLIQLKDGSSNVYPKQMYKAYTPTYTSNSYVSSTNVGRIKIYRFGHVGILHLNMQISTSIPASTSSFEIGSFDASLLITEYYVVAPQSGGSQTLLVSITSSGKLNVANQSSTASGTGWFRAEIPVMFTDTSN